MLSKRPIRVKLLVGLCLLVLLVGILSSSGLYATYSFRDLAKSLSWRAPELALAGDVREHVGRLRITLSELRGLRAATFPHSEPERTPWRARMVRDQFRMQLDQIEDALDGYRNQLERQLRSDSRMADNQHEQETVDKIEAALLRIHQANHDEDWILDDVKIGQLDAELENLQTLTAELPSHLHAKLGGFANDVRGQYRTLIVGTWIVIVSAALVLALFVQLSYQWIFRPLRILIDGSREVAAGRFSYRIRLDTEDEMAELAEAMNDMTARFQDIRDDLDAQVRERTKQVVRSEQLASVGFLAAGVAHEINNPLASIAMCAESLQGRIIELLDPESPDHAVISRYLQMVQDEAFRCKGITEKLLDFSRIGQTERQNADIGELVQGVVDMIGHLGRYQHKQIEFVQRDPVVASINAPEIKQVVLNLLTNALDSLDDGRDGKPPGDDGSRKGGLQKGGTVEIELHVRDSFAELSFTDNGCGIEPDVIEHVFEPFFTRRRAGQGTGLGLSISYRIVADHGGEITAQSHGSGRGATFRIRLPLAQTNKEIDNHNQAA